MSRPPPSQDPQSRERSLERSLRIHRALSLGLALVAAALAVALFRAPSARERAAEATTAETAREAPPGSGEARPPETPDDAEGVGVIPVGERFRELERTRSHATDASENYFQSPTASVHLHAMGFGQTTPLHVHPESHEVTIIVQGVAEVTHVYGERGRRAQRSGSHPPGSLIHSPPLSGHEWFNPAEAAMLANLVIGVPHFSGNLYVKADDPRLLEGGAPFSFDAAAELERFVESGEAQRLEALPPLDGQLSVLFVAKQYRLPRATAGPILAYVVSGEGIARGRLDQRIGPQQLLLFDRASALVLRADAGSPLALYLFDPRPAPRADPPAPR